VTLAVLALAFCTTQTLLMEAVAQSQTPTKAVGPSGPAPPQPGKADGDWSPERGPALTGDRRPLYRLNKSDVVELGFTFSPELNETVPVQPDGFIPLKGGSPVFAEGSTIPHLEELVRRAYAGILHEPEVTVTLREFDKPYFIAAGEVARPGKYDLRSDTTATQAVAIAGGFTDRAKHSQVVLFRHASGDMVEAHLLDVKTMLKTKDLREDIHLQPGDMLYAPQNVISKIKPFMPVSGMSLYLNPTQF
jgi:polysaccharide export outer membrane protein